ncbi:MAG: hypothetical protein OEQ39_14325 [Gammaproteobacteria bacterium]|nr:hypothetical protein [Gammaproteobacteria bacterium]MDH3378119.1 hypothetical protein [Gammaproteobacteria bacterium]
MLKRKNQKRSNNSRDGDEKNDSSSRNRISPAEIGHFLLSPTIALSRKLTAAGFGRWR